jgi:hypothetical protein
MRSLAAAAFALALPFTAVAVEGDFHWTGSLSPGQTLEIKGVNGGIRAELATGPTIEVSGRKTANRSDPNSVRVDVVPHAGGVTICTVYPDTGSGEHNECRPGNGGHMNTRNNDVSVEYTVRLPAGIRFAAKTVNGGITGTGLRSDVNAATVNGKLKIETSGLASGKTVNGSIEAAIGNANWTNPIEFTTVNGSIEISLPTGVSADVQASTVTGHISTDFPLTVSGRFGPKNMNGKIGNGGPALKLSTVNGGIELKRGGSQAL